MGNKFTAEGVEEEYNAKLEKFAKQMQEEGYPIDDATFWIHGVMAGRIKPMTEPAWETARRRRKIARGALGVVGVIGAIAAIAGVIELRKRK